MFEHLEVWRGDPDGDPWLDALPRLLEGCVERWSLTLELGEPWTDSVASLTMPVARGTERLVLKIQFPDREGLQEVEALRRWNGDGAVCLVDHDRDRVRLWTMAHTVAWGFDDAPIPDRIETATWLLDAG